jgi:hypothetical protein
LAPTLGAASVELTRDDLVAIVEQMLLTAERIELLVWKPQANERFLAKDSEALKFDSQATAENERELSNFILILIPTPGVSPPQLESACDGRVTANPDGIRKCGYVRVGHNPPGTPNCGPHQSWKRALVCYRQP